MEEAVYEALKRGRMLTQEQVDALRAEGDELALRAAASNVLLEMCTGRPMPRWALDFCAEFFPDEVENYRKKSSLPIEGRQHVPGMENAVVSGGVPLANSQWERFAVLVASGTDPLKAFVEANERAQKWSAANVQSAVSKWMATPEVSRRIAEIKTQSSSCMVMTAQEFRNRLARKFVKMDEADNIDGMVKIGALLAKVVPDYQAPTRVEHIGPGGYQAPRAVVMMSDEALLRVIKGCRQAVETVDAEAVAPLLEDGENGDD